LLRKGVNLSFFLRKHISTIRFAFISEVKHIPAGAQKMQFSGGWKKKVGSMNDKRKGESWKRLDRSRENQ